MKRKKKSPQLPPRLLLSLKEPPSPQRQLRNQWKTECIYCWVKRHTSFVVFNILCKIYTDAVCFFNVLWVPRHQTLWISLTSVDCERVVAARKRELHEHPKCISVFSLSGVSIEFLCFPRPEEPIEHVMSCLQALFTLLESPWAKTHIAEDQVNQCRIDRKICMMILESEYHIQYNVCV